MMKRPVGRPNKGERISVGLRLPTELHDRLAKAAAERYLSVNWLVVRALEEFLPRLIPVKDIKWTSNPDDTR